MKTRKQHDYDKREPVVLEGHPVEQDEQVTPTLERWDAKVFEARVAREQEPEAGEQASPAVERPPLDVPEEAGEEPRIQKLKVVHPQSSEPPAETERPAETDRSGAANTEPSEKKASSKKSIDSNEKPSKGSAGGYSFNFQFNMGAPPVRQRRGPKRKAQDTAGSPLKSGTGPGTDDRTPKGPVDVRDAEKAGKEQQAVRDSQPRRGRPEMNASPSEPVKPAKRDREGGPSQVPGSASADGRTPATASAGANPSTDEAKPSPVPEQVSSTPDVPLASEEAIQTSVTKTSGDDAVVDEEVDATLLPALPSEQDLETPDRQTRSGYRSHIVLGFLLLLLGIGGFGTWAALAPLKSGINAPGVVKLYGERKQVQHLEGGIIDKILVQEGDLVEKGQVLIRLDDTKARANLEATTSEYYALLARKGRLESELMGLDEVQFPSTLKEKADDPMIKELIDGEIRLFKAQRASINDQLEVYRSWAKGYEREIKGMEAQRKAARTQLVHIKDELQAVETLYKKGLIDKPRLLKLKRTAAGLEGQIGAYSANIERARQKIGEAKLQRVSLINQRRQKATDELQRVETSLLKIEDKLPALRDVFNRLEIRAPQAGRVLSLQYHTKGGVITPSKPILDIVPADARLVVEARISPNDIDVVEPGKKAEIQLTAYSTRKTPQIPGVVTQVSADRIEDPRNGEPYYSALVEIDMDEVRKLPNIKLYPGMPAAVQIVGGERTPIDYLLSPLKAGLRNTWLED